MPLTVCVLSDPDHAPGVSPGPDQGRERALTFDGERVVVGRGPGSDVRLPDPTVSHRHATLRYGKAKSWGVIDEGSTNGTFVGGVRVAPGATRALQHGDFVRVGRVWLEVRIDQAPATSDLAARTRDLALALVTEAMAKIGDDPVVRARVVEGKDLGAVLRLGEEGRVYVLGRAAHCDLPLADEDASREHTRVALRGGEVLVRDAGSKNGTFLADAAVTADCDTTWTPGGLLRIGRTVLVLEEPARLALDELEAAEDERIPEAEPPPPPPGRAPAVEHAGGSPGARSSNAAPIAAIGDGAARPRPRTPSGRWSATDAIVIAVALFVIAASIAGLVWLLGGA